jgi:dienelactone hydrolase
MASFNPRRWLAPLSLIPLTAAIPRAHAAEPAAYPAPAQVRAAFLKLLERPRVPLDVRVTTTKALGEGILLEALSFASEKKADGSIERVPTLVLRPEKAGGRLPAVIVLHGTGGSKDGMVKFMKDLVKRNIIGVAIDARYHGGRAGGAKGSTAYSAAIARAWKTKPGEPMEHPFYYDTCWDLWRLLDYLETRPDVDAKRIGMIGFSMGGIETWLAAAADERVRVAVPAIAVQSFRWSLDHDQWQGRANTIKFAHGEAAQDLGEPVVNQKVCRALWSKIIPGMLDQFDCPSMLRLFAGRPLLIVGGTRDANCPYAGAKIALAAAEQAYAEANGRDKLSIMMADVGHTVTPAQNQAALAWFERWLGAKAGN